MGKKKGGGHVSATLHCVCCKHNCCGNVNRLQTPDNVQNRTNNNNDCSDERRLIADLRTQEKFVTRLVDNIKLMSMYNDETRMRLKKSLESEHKFVKHLEEFQKDFKVLEQNLFHVEVAHIIMLSLSSEVLSSFQELKDLERASGHAIQLCLIVQRKKRSYLRKLIKQCAGQRIANTKLSEDLQHTTKIQSDAEKQVTEIIQNIQTCKDRVSQAVGFEEFMQAYKGLEISTNSIAELFSAFRP